MSTNQTPTPATPTAQPREHVAKLSRQLRAAKFIVSVNGVSNDELIVEFDSEKIADELDRQSAENARLVEQLAEAVALLRLPVRTRIEAFLAAGNAEGK